MWYSPLIADLLTLAREGDAISEPEPVRLADLADGCWRNVATGGAWLVVDTDSVVRADHTRLRQLFENLFRNAVEHAGPDVTVTVGDLSNRGGFFVADDGPGIPEGEREDVFEFGYSTSQEGTGFGLRIVEQVAEAHGWDVSVTESDSGGVSDERSESEVRETSSPGARFEVSGAEFVTENRS